MKKSEPFTHTTGIESAELERELEARHNTILEEAKERARYFGKKNKPDIKDPIEPFINEFKQKYAGMISKVHQYLQGETADKQGSMKQEETNRKIKALQKKRDEIQQEKFNYTMELEGKGINPDDLAKLEPEKRSFNLIIILICIGEAILNISGLQLLGTNWLMSLLMSAGLTGALYLLAKQLAKHLKENTGQGRMKVIITIGMVLLALGVFFVLATLRNEHMKETEHFSIHPLLLVLLNLLMFVVSVVHFYRNSRSSADEATQRELEQCKTKLDGYITALKQCDEEEKELLEHNDNTQKFLVHLPRYAEWLTRRIQHWYFESVEAFKSTNMIHRSDSKTPDCFKETNYPPLNSHNQ